MNQYFKNGLALAFAFSSSIAWSVPIAIIDSGTDFKHAALANRTWTNPGGITGDTFADDTHGWNFADNNNQTIDYSYYGKFSPDTTKFFEVQLRLLNGAATADDISWMKSKQGDSKFIEELETFGNFAHGTHVSGIASRASDQAEIMSAKIIPTEVKQPPAALLNYLRLISKAGKTPFSFSLNDTPTDPAGGSLIGAIGAIGGFFEGLLLKGALWYLAGQQSNQLEPVGKYVAATGMRVANCSFGTGTAQAKAVVNMLAKSLLKRDLTEAEEQEYALFFMGEIIDKGKSFVNSAPETLFVIAAGNDASDNDKIPDYPGNLREENTLTVAATRDYDRLASFSNYGSTMVDIAAPGVGIQSSYPSPSEHDTLAMSGTSQASPFVANLAGRVMDKNPRLTLSEVKSILMQTVDKKPFLVGKVVSGGIANEERAVRAAQHSLQESVDDAIRHARSEVVDVTSNRARMRTNSILTANDSGDDGVPVKRPSLFQILK